MAGPAKHSPTIAAPMPKITAVASAVCTALFARSGSFMPSSLATTTLAPSARPMQNAMMRPMTGTLLPTPAIDSFETKRPSTATSAALKSCWSMPVKARGRAKTIILSQIDPLSMSIFLFLRRISLRCPLAGCCSAVESGTFVLPFILPPPPALPRVPKRARSSLLSDLTRAWRVGPSRRGDSAASGSGAPRWAR